MKNIAKILLINRLDCDNNKNNEIQEIEKYDPKTGAFCFKFKEDIFVVTLEVSRDFQSFFRKYRKQKIGSGRYYTPQKVCYPYVIYKNIFSLDNLVAK